MKESEQIEQKRQQIIDQLLAHGWRPNVKFFTSGRGEGKMVDERGKGGYYGYHYLISADGKMALTIKPLVILAYNVSTEYSIDVSMMIQEAEVDDIGLRAGKLMIFH